ncbi:S8 family serine peptidase [Reichenbachiella ulvae]|uniref:S8 family serine peptidase n=1 Tax=Reichenbachiella ulvae TaxID=2980104 RepID=A0ABT3CRG3_9BACT|nr:S8 family serine peptidase [Reichenbachiella ulvae]MCV9386094.1 S8 family serine peptidase [Reichenbachiella ulvae]
MGKGIRLLFLGMALGMVLEASAEKHRFMVFFADKADSPYSIDAPLEFLSQKALDRRNKSGQSVTEEDLPVNANYLDSLVKYNITPYYSSRWFNAALVEADSVDLESIVATSYILSYEYIAPGVRLNPVKEVTDVNFSPLEPSIISSNSQIQIEMLGVHTMHDQGYNGAGIHVAVFDGGFEAANQTAVFKDVFNNDRLIDRMDFTANSDNVFNYDDHGTNAMSCIVSNYKETLIGTGYGADISLYVTEDVSDNGNFEYRIEEYNWLLAAERADSVGVDIISSSLGYFDFNDDRMDYSYEEDADGLTSVITRAANLATERGILVVSSAGNEGRSTTWKYITMPSDSEHVIAVGAVNSLNEKLNFSSFGPTADGRVKPDVVALGSSVAVYHKNNTIGTSSGTSFSAPLITGLVAGMWQQFPELTNLEIKELLLEIGDHSNLPNNETGYGLPNYRRLINDSVLSVKAMFDESFTVFPNPFEGNYVLSSGRKRICQKGSTNETL